MEKIWLKSWPDGMPLELDFPNKPLHDFLRDNALKSPAKIAINYYGKEIKFQELDDLSDRFAAALRDLGLQKGDRVSLYLENCPQFVMAYFGALKAGGVVVAANPMFKEDELLYELKDSGADILVTLDHLYPLVKEVRKRIRLPHVIVTSYWDFLPENPSLPIHPSMQPAKEVFPRTFDFCDLLEKWPPYRPQSLAAKGPDPTSCCQIRTYKSGRWQSLARLRSSWCRNCKPRKLRRRYTPLPVRGMRKTTLCRFFEGFRASVPVLCAKHVIRHAWRKTFMSSDTRVGLCRTFLTPKQTPAPLAT